MQGLPETIPFTARDAAAMAAVAAMWGSSFLFIGIGVDHFAPAIVSCLRLAFGAVAVGLLPAARRPVARAAWRSCVVLALLWMAVPFTLFAVAERTIDTSLAGMINGAAPIFTALVAALMTRTAPSRVRAAGLALGFAGVVVVCLPSIDHGSGHVVGLLLVLVGVACYGISFNLTGELQRRYGALPIVWRAQIIASLLLAPLAVAGARHSTFAWSSAVAVLALGALSTGAAFVLFTDLAGRIGSTRASVATYFIPVVAMILGAVFRDERIAPLAIAGVALVLVGAFLATRGRPGASAGALPEEPEELEAARA